MANRLLPDDLWNEIERLFPEYAASPDGGRPPKDARTVLTAILFVLKTGIAWADLPPEAFGVSYKTCLRRIDQWTHLGIWRDARVVPGQAAWRGPLGLVTGAGRLQFSEGPLGRAKTGPNPTDRGRSGSKHCLLTDAGGAPLVLDLVAANQHDLTTLLPMVVELPAVAGKPGRPKRWPKTLVADKAFDCESLRRLLRWLGIEPIIAKRGDDEQGLGVVRWFIERTISWLHQFRRLRIRWDRKPEVHQAFLSLASAIICYRIWNNAS